MMLVLVFLVLAVAAAAVPKWHELEGYTFDQYNQDFKLKLVPGSGDYNLRKGLFDVELVRLKAHNAKNLSWKEGINKFSVMTPAEKKAFFGRNKHIAKNFKKSSKYAQPFDHGKLGKSIDALPATVNWQSVSTAVKDQGYCGSCWAFASTTVIESHVAISTGLLYDLSVQQMTSCAPNPDSCGGTGGCAGATAELAFDYVASSTGMLEEFQYGYSSYYGTTGTCSLPSSNTVATITGYVQLPQNNYTGESSCSY
jgi:cathepsin L